MQGPKGKMTVAVPRGIRFEQKDGTLWRCARTKARTARCMAWRGRWWPTRCAASPTGFKKDLDIVGVGYRAEVKGKNVVLALGYSHPIEFPIPEGITISVEKQTHMSVSGADKDSGRPGGRQSARAASARPV